METAAARPNQAQLPAVVVAVAMMNTLITLKKKKRARMAPWATLAAEIVLRECHERPVDGNQ